MTTSTSKCPVCYPATEAVANVTGIQQTLRIFANCVKPIWDGVIGNEIKQVPSGYGQWPIEIYDL